MARHPYQLLRAAGSFPQNDTLFDVVSSPPATGKEQLWFTAGPPRAVALDAIPSELVFERFSMQGNACRLPNDELGGVGSTLVSTPDGALLVVNAGMWLRAGGQVETPGMDKLPFDVRWVESSSCQPCGPLHWRAVALELRMKGAAAPLLQALPGDEMPLQLDGRDYLFFSSARAIVEQGCGEGGWSLVRKDVLITLDEDGGVVPAQRRQVADLGLP